MPNWCVNRLYVRGPQEQVLAFTELARGTDTRYKKEQESREEEDLVFNKLVPMPKKILAKPYDPDGYYWELSNWGCKWGACNSRLLYCDSRGAGYEFHTPWSPPIALFLRVSKRFPELTFTLIYSEGGMAFAGFAIFHNKELKVEVATTDYSDDYLENLSEFFRNAEYSYVVEDVGLQVRKAVGELPVAKRR